MEKAYFEVELRIENYCKGDGKVVIKEDVFEGYIALDYISGCYKNGTLYLKVLTFEDKISKNFESTVDLFELPNFYYLKEKGGEYAKIDFLSIIKDKEKQKNFDLLIERIRKMHGFSEKF